MRAILSALLRDHSLSPCCSRNFRIGADKLHSALQELSFEIQRHANRGTISKFFGSIVDNEELQYHIRALDSLTTEIGVRPHVFIEPVSSETDLALSVFSDSSWSTDE